MPDLRPMTAEDAEAVAAVQNTAFEDLARRFNEPFTAGPVERMAVRIRHCVETTPAGAGVSTDGDGAITGAALAIVREGLWGLSLLVVDPEAQSGGAGRALLAAALEPAAGTRGGIILASGDNRALRVYQRAGFTLRPSFDGVGTVRSAPVRPQTVREGRWPEDRELCDAASRVVRGAAHGDDIGAMLAAGGTLLVHDAGGFAVSRGSSLQILAAQDETAARELLRAVLALSAEAESFDVGFMDAEQAWAMEELLDAGVDLRPAGAVAVRGEVGPLRPYLPSGAYL